DPGPGPVTGTGMGATAPDGAPVNLSRGARYLLRNGWDYVTYQEYERALAFFREAQARQAELSDPERVRLKQGIERARRGRREAANGVKSEPAYALNGRSRRPGAIALADPDSGPKAPRDRDPIQLAGGGNAGGNGDANANPNAANVRASGPSESARMAPA